MKLNLALSKNLVGTIVTFILILVLTHGRFFDFLLNSNIGRVFLIFLILAISSMNKIFGVVFILFFIIIFNQSDFSNMNMLEGFREGKKTKKDSEEDDEEGFEGFREGKKTKKDSEEDDEEGFEGFREGKKTKKDSEEDDEEGFEGFREGKKTKKDSEEDDEEGFEGFREGAKKKSKSTAAAPPAAPEAPAEEEADDEGFRLTPASLQDVSRHSGMSIEGIDILGKEDILRKGKSSNHYGVYNYARRQSDNIIPADNNVFLSEFSNFVTL